MAGRRIVHQLGHDKRVNPVFTLFIDRAVVLIPGVHTPGRRAKHNARPRRQFAGKAEARLLQRFFRGDQGELCEAVIKNDLLTVEQCLGVIVFDLPADLDRQPVHITQLQLGNATAPFAHGLQCRGHILPQSVDRALPGNDNPSHFWSATSPSTAFTIAATLEISKSL